jgi:hypothetical protein
MESSVVFLVPSLTNRQPSPFVSVADMKVASATSTLDFSLHRSKVCLSLPSFFMYVPYRPVLTIANNGQRRALRQVCLPEQVSGSNIPTFQQGRLLLFLFSSSLPLIPLHHIMDLASLKHRQLESSTITPCRPSQYCFSYITMYYERDSEGHSALCFETFSFGLADVEASDAQLTRKLKGNTV